MLPFNLVLPTFLFGIKTFCYDSFNHKFRFFRTFTWCSQCFVCVHISRLSNKNYILKEVAIKEGSRHFVAALGDAVYSIHRSTDFHQCTRIKRHSRKIYGFLFFFNNYSTIPPQISNKCGFKQSQLTNIT